MLALKHLEARAAARRNVRELLGEPELLDRRRGVATACDRDRARCRCVDNSGRHRTRSRVKRRHFEHAHRAVPNDRLRRADRRAKRRARRGADVETHPSVGNRANRGHRLRARLELAAARVIARQQDLAALGLCLRENLLRELDAIRLDQAVAGRDALRAEERVRHRAADDQSIDLRHQVLDGHDLVGHLRAAEDREERLLCRGNARDQVFELRAQQESAHAPLALRAHRHRKRVHRRVRAVARAERIVDVDVAEPSELVGERSVALLLALGKAQVVEQHHAAFGHRGNRRTRGVVGAVVRRERHAVRRVGAEQFGQALRDGRERELGLKALALRPSQVAGEHGPSASGEDRANRRQARLDPAVVGYGSAVHRDVEIHAHEHPLAGHIHRVDSLLLHRGRTIGRIGRFARNAVPADRRPCAAPNLSRWGECLIRIVALPRGSFPRDRPL